MRAVILAAGQVHDYGRIQGLLGRPDLVICADGGVRHALALGLTPTLVVGDFDSVGPGLVEQVAARGIPVRQVPVVKDETDTHLAVLAAVEEGAQELLLVGATGSRLDHTLANLLLMPALPSEVEVTMVDANNVIRLLRPGGRLTIHRVEGEYLSLVPLTPEVKGVVLEGVKWPLEGVTLRWGQTVGVSNEIVEEEAFVAAREGYLLVISAWD